MDSISAHITDLHRAYCYAAGLDPEDMPMNACWERWWYQAIEMGVTQEHVELGVAERLRVKRSGGMNKGLELRHLIKSEETISELLNEVAVIKARQRIKRQDPAKLSVLAAVGRTTEPPKSDAKLVGDLGLLKALKEAAQ